MIDPPKLLTTTEQRTAVIRLTIPRAQIQQVMGPAIGEVFGAVAAQGLTPAGRWFTRHFRFDPATFDFEVGVPVNADVQPSGRVGASSLPGVKVARALYRGGYEGLPKAWPELDAWIRAQGLTPAEWLWETYLTDPVPGSDPATWRTELTRPLM
jgi:effector-binding domain-containing protein